MGLDKDANSTEALLEIIRGNEDASPPAQGTSVGQPPPKKKKESSALVSLRKRVVLGVEVERDSLSLVKVSGSDPAFHGAVVERVFLPEDAEPGSDEFIAILRKSIIHLCGRGSSPEVWITLQSPDVDLSPVLIPKVSSSKVADTVYWTIKKEKKFDEKEYVFDIQPGSVIKDEGVSKLEVLTGLGRRERVDELARWFEQAGFPLAGITPVSAAIQNFYARGLGPDVDGLVGLIHVASDYSAITILDGSRILFSRTIKSGVNSMAEALMHQLNSNGDSGTTDIAQARKLLLARFQGKEAALDGAGAGLPDEELFEIIVPALLRLARQADRTLEYYFNNFKQRCSALHLSGELFASSKVCEYMSVQLGLPAAAVRMLPEGARLGDNLQEDRLAFNTAAALAMSESGKTINLLVNHVQRAKNIFWQRVNNGVTLAGLGLLLVVLGLFGWQKVAESQKQAKLEQLTKQYEAISPKVSHEQLETMAESLINQHGQLRKLGERYEAFSTLAELTRYTPPGIRFLSIRIEEEGTILPGAQKEGVVEKTAQAPGGVMILDGVVLPSGEDYNTALSRFLINIDSSPLFDKYQVLSSEITELSTEGEVLHFVLQVSLV